MSVLDVSYGGSYILLLQFADNASYTIIHDLAAKG
jgi:hypothetical protein